MLEWAAAFALVVLGVLAQNTVILAVLVALAVLLAILGVASLRGWFGKDPVPPAPKPAHGDYPINVADELARREAVATVEADLEARMREDGPVAIHIEGGRGGKITGSTFVGHRRDIEAIGHDDLTLADNIHVSDGPHGFSGAVGRTIVCKCGFEAPTKPDFDAHLRAVSQ